MKKELLFILALGVIGNIPVHHTVSALETTGYDATSVHYYKGISSLKKKRFKQAIQEFSKALEYDPKNIDAYYYRGFAYELLNDFKMAIRDYSKTIELNPMADNAYLYRGMCHFSLRNWDAALSDFTRSIEVAKKLTDEHYISRAGTYAVLGKYNEALKDINKAIAINPKSGQAYIFKAGLQIELGNAKEAILAYEKAIPLHKKNDFIYELRGYSYNAIGQYEKAIEDFDIALKGTPRNRNKILKQKHFAQKKLSQSRAEASKKNPQN